MPKAVKKISIDKKIEELSKKLDDVKKSAVQYEKGAEKKIQDNPVQSVAMAFGAGLVAGALAIAMMRRRR